MSTLQQTSPGAARSKTADAKLSVTVLVPTYRRPEDLRRCLGALQEQTRPADEIVVTVRVDDRETWDAIAEFDADFLRLRTVSVTAIGVVHALNAGVATISSDIVAITDDDAAPRADWLERIVGHFAERPDLGGVGGRDYMRIDNVLQEGRKAVVGKIPKLGKSVTYHHLGFGPPREVDILKGVNCCYRTGPLKKIGFDTRLRGTGAQVHWEMSLGLAMKRAGWKLLYDPSVAVDHFVGKRFDEDQRVGFSALAVSNMVFNETLIRIEMLSPAMRFMQLAWSIVVGTRSSPGFVQWLRFLPTQRGRATSRFRAALAGRIDAWRFLNTAS